MLSFTATVNVLLLILSIATLHAPRRVAGAPVNATLRLDSPLVSFTPGWRAATFAGDGSQFAFTDGLNEEMLITLPPQTTQVFYRGYKVAGGALFLACVDCAVDVVNADLVGINSTALVVDAHDSTENGTQPATTGTGTTAGTTTATTGTATSAGLPGATITAIPPPSSSTSAGVTTTGTTDSGTTAQTETTSQTTTGGVPGTTTSTQSTAANPTGTQTTVASQPDQPGTTTSAPTDPSSTGTGGTSTVTSSNPPNGSPQSTSGSNPPNGSSQTTAGGGGTATGAGATQTTGSNPTGNNTPSPSISPVFSGVPATPSGMSAPAPDTKGASTGISKPAIIAIAAVVSLIVLALLGAAIYVLVRNRGGPPPGDKEGQAGLIRETTATPTAMVSAPVPIAFAPMRPQNPFADSVSADIPLDEPIAFGESYVVDEVFAQPPPRPPRKFMHLAVDLLSRC
ncbi:hypothetical protein TRAPUB_10866 [Trametes pubescens]|uniref:Accumulation-associated protein n=1 Tax=Trametes pubescens TaxID=154538 RepID=A0A1M2VYF8_TRAPU|nr:hypothetical protein TRAPUB_10866 [Trametes pubescens]